MITPPDPRPPLLPGLTADRLLGAGAHAHVWSARPEGAPDVRVAVKVARPGAQDRLRREADLLERARHPHVVRLRDVVEPVGGGLALVLDLADGGSLTALLAARGTLSPGESTTVVVPIARALAALHERGVVHGDVTAANVLLTAQGRPLLVDLGVAAVADRPADGVLDARWGTPGWTDPDGLGRSRPGPDADVWALGALLRFCLTGAPTGDPATRPDDPPDQVSQVQALLDVARRCEGPAASRPSPAEVARAVWDACPPAAIRFPLTGAASGVRPGDQHGPSAPEITRRIRADAAAATPAPVERRRGGRRAAVPVAVRWAAVAAVAGAVGVVGVVGVGGVHLGARPAPSAAVPPSVGLPPSSAGRPSPSPEDLVAVVRDLARARASALVAAAPEGLAAVDAEGSPALAADVALLAELDRRGLRYEGLQFHVDRVGVVMVSDDRARVSAVVSTSAHRQVDPSGTVLLDVPAAAPRAVTLDLVRTAAGWRVAAATPQP